MAHLGQKPSLEPLLYNLPWLQERIAEAEKGEQRIRRLAKESNPTQHQQPKHTPERRGKKDNTTKKYIAKDHIQHLYLSQNRELEISSKFQTFANFIEIRKASSLHTNINLFRQYHKNVF